MKKIIFYVVVLIIILSNFFYTVNAVKITDNPMSNHGVKFPTIGKIDNNI